MKPTKAGAPEEKQTAPPLKRYTRPMILRRVAIVLVLVSAAIVAWWNMIRMPGRSFSGSLPPLSTEQVALRDEMLADVRTLAGEIGERNIYRGAGLTAAAGFIERSLSGSGFHPRREGYDVHGVPCDNIEAELRGIGSPEQQEQIVVVGAHYDTVPGCPGANDNGSGVASLLALSRRFAGKPCARTLRFVAFVNEEPVHFQTEQMGSWVYASRCKARNEHIAAMISLETVGCFSHEAGSQKYPVPLLGAIYPTAGNFIAFVGNIASRKLVRQAIGSFRRHAEFPSEGAALPPSIPGIGWSDHWSFWQHGYRAIMVTDTAPFRYPHYHFASDTPDKLDYDSMARVVSGLQMVIRDLTHSVR